jgi:hypothetical protein
MQKKNIAFPLTGKNPRIDSRHCNDEVIAYAHLIKSLSCPARYMRDEIQAQQVRKGYDMTKSMVMNGVPSNVWLYPMLSLALLRAQSQHGQRSACEQDLLFAKDSAVGARSSLRKRNSTVPIRQSMAAFVVHTMM